MRRDARVAIAVFDQENPYQQAMIQGRVVEMVHEGAEEHIDAMAKKYMGVDSYPFRKEGEQRGDREDRTGEGRADGIGRRGTTGRGEDAP